MRAFLFGALIILLTPLSYSQSTYKPKPGNYQVETLYFDWIDSDRKRQVPVKIFYPQGKGPFPIVVVSHGLGGSREGYKFLGSHWASHGYVSVHVQHIGSDSAVWKGKSKILKEMRSSAGKVQNTINRPLDVSFTIDQMEKMNLKGVLKNKLNLKSIAVAGHSFGALTANMIAGQILYDPSGKAYNFSDKRIKAAISMSSPLGVKMDKAKKSYENVNIPCLHMTGTKDNSPIGKTTVEQRRVPFDSSKSKDQFLINFQNGDHMIFSGMRRFAKRKSDLVFQDLIRQSSVAFLDAYLKNNMEAKKWLRKGSFKKTLGKNGSFELR